MCDLSALFLCFFQLEVGKFDFVSNHCVIEIHTPRRYNLISSCERYLNGGYIMKLNEQIAFLRKEKGITQEELANALGVSNQAVSKWENGVSHS